MESDGLSANSDLFRSQNQSFKDEFDEQLFWLLANNLPTATIVANNALILQRLSLLIANDLQPLVVKNNVEFVSTHVFGSQANGLALKDSDIDVTILTQKQKRGEKTPDIYGAFKKIPESRFLKLGFCRKFTFNMIYLPVMKQELLIISNVQTKKNPTLVQSIDLLINGFDGIRNSMAIGHLVKTSKTYHYLVLSLKLWLSQFPRRQRMPLYSYYIMAAHYLQHIVHPALLPPVDLRPFKEESFREKILAQSNISPFEKVDLTDIQGFSGLSSLLKGFFHYYGIQYKMDDNKPPIFVSQYPSEESNHIPVDKRQPSKSTSKPAFNVLDPLTDQVILDLKAFAKKTNFHSQDMEDAYNRLKSNQNIFPPKVVNEKEINVSKPTNDRPPTDADDEADDELLRVTQKEQNILSKKVMLKKAPAQKFGDNNAADAEDDELFRVNQKQQNIPSKKVSFTKATAQKFDDNKVDEAEDDEPFRVTQKEQNIPSKKVMFTKATAQKFDDNKVDEAEDDEHFRVIQKEQNDSKINLNIFPEKVLFAKAAAEKLAQKNEDDKELRITEQKRVTRRINDSLERKILFQKPNQKQASIESDSLSKPFFKKENQPKQFRLAESDPEESVSEVQQQKDKKIKFAKVRSFTKILRVLPK